MAKQRKPAEPETPEPEQPDAPAPETPIGQPVEVARPIER